MHKIHFDSQTGIVHIKTSGFWTVADADQYLAEVGEMLEIARRAKGRALTLIDARDSKVQAPEVIERLAGIQKLILRLPDDRVAHVPNSVLLKMQVQRMITSPQAHAFLSLDEGEAWLLGKATEG